MSSEESPLLTIRDAAERLQVTPRTLKYYEELGLVTPTRSGGRYRLYGEQDLERFARILRLRSLGFSLQGIIEMLKRPLEPVGDGRKGYSVESLRQIGDALAQQIDALDARISAVRRELKEARALRDELGDDLDYLRRRIAGEKVENMIDQRIAARRKREKPRRDEGSERSEGDEGTKGADE
ncbi:MerR family transcriptional regulator [Burkholderia guangdongensis]|uniref:MerR family transcriptional regulator n=1 Tax=Burkholderia guangdongensis TaxID=1792500 RepID=UPI0015CD8014|nr:MerR family transcriptional regulator [Burkholderia guangdongensis]